MSCRGLGATAENGEGWQTAASSTPLPGCRCRPARTARDHGDERASWHGVGLVAEEQDTLTTTLHSTREIVLGSKRQASPKSTSVPATKTVPLTADDDSSSSSRGSRCAARRVWRVDRLSGRRGVRLALGWTVAAVFFVRELGLRPLQLVLAGTALEVAYFFFEIPTGSWPTRTAGGFRSSSGPRTRARLCHHRARDGVWLVLLAAAFMGFAWTFKSGADEAWITDEVGVDNAGEFVAGRRAGLRIGSLTGSAPRWDSR